ncbi:MAG: winged helix-turn-helix transcriptional regulator [Actinobacteria bacterium]|nr:winged helix-turn-helix transcriptional regulator [Actinomycetota bacterium]
MARTEAMGLARLFKAIADPTRLQILSLITSAPEHELCACELYEPLGLSQPTVSHHLKVLHDAGILDRESRGTWAWYSIRREALDELSSVLHLEATSSPSTAA